MIIFAMVIFKGIYSLTCMSLENATFLDKKQLVEC